ncbi:MAG TPA: DUF1871 family protein [Pseudoneobacillus sp.]|nr:DUF1871 family protein [Pseudoneobacillus sp.]
MLEIQEMHIRLVIALNEWDPFGLGFGQYETEIADVVQVVHTSDDVLELANKIQGIYEFSFEQIIPIESCKKIATELLNIKNEGSCSL